MSLKRLSSTDGIWLSLESADTPMHAAFLLEFSAPEGVGAADFIQQWRDQLRDSQPLSQPWNLVPVQTPLRGLLPLVRDIADVDLEQHIRQHTLAQPAGHAELIRLVTEIHREQLDMTRPPWELHVIDGLAEDRFALLVKVHHSLFDGVSLMRLFTDTFTEDPAARDTPQLFTVSRAAVDDPTKDGAGKGNPFRALLVALRGVWDLLRGMGTAVGESFRRARGDKSMPQKAYQQPDSILNGPITGARELSTRRYDLALIKQLAKAGDCTVNDIVLYLVSTALRGYLDEHAELPAQTLTAGVPVDLRGSDDVRVGTRAGMMFTALATDVAEPRERLAAMKHRIRAAKAHIATMSPNGVIGYGLAVTLPWVLGLSFGFHKARASHPMGISNVPGPRKPLYWNGARLDALYPVSLLLHGNAVNFTCVGYTDGLHFGVLGASEQLPPVEYLTAGLDAALAELSEILLGPDAQTSVA